MAQSEEPRNPSEQALKGGRDTVVSLWLLLGIVVVVALVVTALIGRRPVSGTGPAASLTPAPHGLASGAPNVNAAVPDTRQPAPQAPAATPPPGASVGNQVPTMQPQAH